jgi:hypothetical protein
MHREERFGALRLLKAGCDASRGLAQIAFGLAQARLSLQRTLV